MSDVKFDLYDEFGKEITTLTENIDRTASQKDFVDRLTPKAKQELYNKLHIESDEKQLMKIFGLTIEHKD